MFGLDSETPLTMALQHLLSIPDGEAGGAQHDTAISASLEENGGPGVRGWPATKLGRIGHSGAPPSRSRWRETKGPALGAAAY